MEIWPQMPVGVLNRSLGRALEWHSRGQRFDPAYLHQKILKPLVSGSFLFARTQIYRFPFNIFQSYDHIDAPHRTTPSASGRVQTTLLYCRERDKSPAPCLSISGAVDFRRINKMYEENGNHSLQSAGFCDKIAVAYWQYCTQMFRIVQ